MMSEQTCKTVQAVLAIRPADRSVVEQRLVDAHLLACARCAEWARACAKQDRQLAQATSPARLDASQRERLFSRLNRERRWSEMFKKWSVGLKTTAGIAAIVALIFVLNLVFSQLSKPGSVRPGGVEPTATAAEVASIATQTPAQASVATATEVVPAATSTPKPEAMVPTDTPSLAPTTLPTATMMPTDTPSPAPTALPIVELVEMAHMAAGVESLALTEPQPVLETVVDLGLGWYKQEVSWAAIEPVRGEIAWTYLDPLVEAADGAGIKLLFSVADAPLWTHSKIEGQTLPESIPDVAVPGQPALLFADPQYQTPPDDVQDMATFVGALAERYRGRVHAYEIWQEQNLTRSWDATSLNGAAYIELLRAAFRAIKIADPDALVVSGGPVPTGINDGVWAVDHLTYLQQMYDAGLQDVCDVVGVHAYGYANSPDVYYQGGDFDSTRAYDDHRSFFFRNTVEDMYSVMAANGDGNKRIWITEFGWGAIDGLDMDAPRGYEYTADINEQQQADYIVRAYTWAAQQGYVGGAFLYTVDVSPARSDVGLLYSITRPDGAPRPAYTAIQDMMAAQAGVAETVDPVGDFVWPVTGTISSLFGNVTDEGVWHGGIDIMRPEGTDVVAADGGIVIWAGFATTREGYGNLIVIDHGNGFETLYAHLDRIGVAVGQQVVQGEVIGAVGQTGKATGPHLHFEIRKRGVRVDPLAYLP